MASLALESNTMGGGMRCRTYRITSQEAAHIQVIMKGRHRWPYLEGSVIRGQVVLDMNCFLGVGLRITEKGMSPGLQGPRVDTSQRFQDLREFSPFSNRELYPLALPCMTCLPRHSLIAATAPSASTSSEAPRGTVPSSGADRKSPILLAVATYVPFVYMQGHPLKNKASPRECVDAVAEWYSTVMSGYQGQHGFVLRNTRSDDAQGRGIPKDQRAGISEISLVLEGGNRVNRKEGSSRVWEVSSRGSGSFQRGDRQYL
ncbi:hypothetical protein BC827DRAFT_1157936 [Russula dissimulans]|nr:hypothetical protein BC827DRAFT_1157936 [Russula dissimulans]